MTHITEGFKTKQLTGADFRDAGWVTEAGTNTRGGVLGAIAGTANYVGNATKGHVVLRQQVAQLDGLALQVLETEDARATRFALANLRRHGEMVNAFNGSIHFGIGNHEKIIAALEAHLDKLERFGTTEPAYVAAHALIGALDKRTDLTTTKGIFRLSGSATNIEVLKGNLFKGEEVNFAEYSIHDLACALKACLRQTKESILDPATLERASNKNELKQMVHSMPVANRRLLRKLSVLSQQIAGAEEETAMGYPNLAMTLAPTLVRKEYSPGTNPLEKAQLELDATPQRQNNVLKLLKAGQSLFALPTPPAPAASAPPPSPRALARAAAAAVTRRR
jgi:RhoGAP domain